MYDVSLLNTVAKASMAICLHTMIEETLLVRGNRQNIVVDD